MVNDKQRIVKVRAGMERTLLTVLPIITHEVGHVIQHENKRAIGDLAIMKHIGIDRASEQFEAGGKWQEKVAREGLTGESKTTVAGTGYYNMLEVKSKGGSFGECVEAYFTSLRAAAPDMSIKDAVDQAVNRAQRVYREGGYEYAKNTEIVTNSQPLFYLEQQLIYENLEEEHRDLLLIGGITLRNLIGLQREGLVDLHKMTIPEKKAWELLHPHVKQLIQSGEYRKVSQHVRKVMQAVPTVASQYTKARSVDESVRAASEIRD